MKNAYTADTPIEIDGQQLMLRYDWRAFGAIRTEFGQGAKIGDLVSGVNPDDLAKMIAIGLHKHHSGKWTAEMILDASPPIQAAVDAVSSAINAAYFGPAGPPKVETTNPLVRIAKRLVMVAIRFLRRSSSGTAAG